MVSEIERRGMALTEGLVAMPVTARPRIDARWWFWLRRVMRDLLPAIGLYALYGLFRRWQPDYAPEAAMRNAADLVAFQAATGLDIDRGWQVAALGHSWLITFANWFYILGWAPVLLAVAIFAFIRAPVVLERWRIVLTLTALATAIVQFAWPLAPPRIYEPYGMIDTLMTFGPTYYGTVGDTSGAINVYGAMPSMHVGWSLLAALIMRAVLPGRWWVTLGGAMYVATMTWTVVVTGNHYLLDPIVGVLLVLLAIAIGRIWNDRRIGQLRRRSATLPA
ncbi:MAG TPA: phosphatase PAP2 family protein [Thermomicrobiales bacterium]|jgi:hypothetical protein|nr:phosphatase PAP2 family protein [Thermomicrobiales bacterium]